MEEKDKLDQITRRIIGAAIENFTVRVLKDGLKRIVNEFPDSAFSATSAVG
ncbi:MAG: hypothetical protein ABSC15_18460 [Terriglobales bacterium]|jgi:hypothetical protein